MQPVRVEKLSKYYGPIAALEDASLQIKKGEIFFLLGPSGCGKTTLLRIIAGLTPPSSGRVFIGGRDITEDPPHIRKTAMVFQNYALWPHMSVADNVRFAMTIKKVDKTTMIKKAGDALKIVHMETYADKKPAQLSGGQQQRVALARAIAADPRCLLLDEPLSNLDANLRIEMRTEIRRICKQTGITTIYVTHDQKESLSIADRIAILNEGKVEQVAAPTEIYSKPATKFVAGFIGETNFISGKIESIEADMVTIVRGKIQIQVSTFSPYMSEGNHAVCCIRPENFKLTHQGGDAPNEIRGKVRRVTFLGELTQYEIELEDSLQVKVIETTPETIRNEGESVVLRIKPGDVNVYQDKDE